MLQSYHGVASTHEPDCVEPPLIQGYAGNCIVVPLLLLPMGREQTGLYHTRSALRLPLVESEAPGSPSPSFAITYSVSKYDFASAMPY